MNQHVYYKKIIEIVNLGDKASLAEKLICVDFLLKHLLIMPVPIALKTFVRIVFKF